MFHWFTRNGHARNESDEAGIKLFMKEHLPEKPEVSAGHCFSEADLWQETLSFKGRSRELTRRLYEILEFSQMGYTEAFRMARSLITHLKSFVPYEFQKI